MAEAAIPQAIGMQGMPVGRSPDYRSVYANSSQVRITPWDFGLAFSRLGEIIPGTLGIEQVVDVTLTPAQAKAFVIALHETVKAFEEAFGEIKLDPLLVPSTEFIHAIVHNVKDKIAEQKAQLEKAAMAALKTAKP